MSSTRDLRGQILLNEGLITEEQLSIALAEQKKTGEKIGQCFIRLGFVSEDDMLLALEHQFGITSRHISEEDIDKSAIESIPDKLIWEYNFIPIKQENNALQIAISDPLSYEDIDSIKFIVDKEIFLILVPDREINDLIKKYYGSPPIALKKEEHKKENVLYEEESETEIDVDIVNFVDQLILDAYKKEASEIHIESFVSGLKIRLRIDDKFRTVNIKNLQGLESLVIPRIKDMAKLGVAKTFQQGCIKLNIMDERICLTVFVAPGFFGENIILKIINKDNNIVDYTELGFFDQEIEKVESFMEKTNGLVLVTGPVCSGKTTTLYSLLTKMAAQDKKIITIERAVKYWIENIIQIPLKQNILDEFETILNLILNQNPNVLMIKDIIDAGSFETVMQVAITKCLVFASLNADNALSAIIKLRNMGISSYLQAHSIKGIISQQSIRIICDKCRQSDLRVIPKSLGNIKRCYKGKGCDFCEGSGYKGVTSVFEVVTISDKLKDLLISNAEIQEIEKEINNNIIQTFKGSVLKKLKAAITTKDEALRIFNL
jgi:type IV pilus assembly protein PilB